MSANLSEAANLSVPLVAKPTAGRIRGDAHAGRDIGAAVAFALIGLVITFLILALSPGWEGVQALALAG